MATQTHGSRAQESGTVAVAGGGTMETPGTPKARGTGSGMDEEEEVTFVAEKTAALLPILGAPNDTGSNWATLAKAGAVDITKKQRVNAHIPMEEAKGEVEETSVSEEGTIPMTTADEIQPPPLPPRMRLMPSMISEECKYLTYFDLKMPVGSSGAHGPIFTKLGQFCRRVHQLDSEMKLFPYLLENRKAAHIVIQDQQTWQDVTRRRSMTTLAKYFNNASGGGWQGYRTVQILLGTSVPPKDLITDLGDFLRPNDGPAWFMYIRQLQAEETECIGWLYLSLKVMDLKKLQEGIQAVVGFPVGLQWRVITPAIRADRVQEVRAIHVIVDKNHAAADKEIIRSMYSSCRKEGWPLGIRMRFVQEASMVQGTEDPVNLMKMRNRQHHHVRRVKVVKSTDFNGVDTKCSVLKKSIRETLMELKPANSSSPLFLYISPSEKGGGHDLHVLPQYVVEAQMTVNNLLPYLKFKAGDRRAKRIEVLFTDSALRKNRGLVWDPIRGCARDEYSIQLEALVNNEDDADFYCDMEVVVADEAMLGQRQVLTNVDEASLGSGSTATVGSYTVGDKQVWKTPAAKGSEAFQAAVLQAREWYGGQGTGMGRGGGAAVSPQNQNQTVLMANNVTPDSWAGTRSPMEVQENQPSPLAPEQGGWCN
jgi:hypothetical protein